MTLEELFDTWQGQCAYCGSKVKLKPETKEKRFAATRDHYIPLAVGGGKGKRNHVLACTPCNAQKASFDPRVMIRVWHRLDAKSLQAFVDSLDEPKLPVGIRGRLRALLRPHSRLKKRLN